MTVARSIHLSTRLIGAFVLGAAAMLFGGLSFAAEGPNLPPAEYKPLPVGTTVKYGNWEYTVTRSDGFETVIKESRTGQYVQRYGVFGRQGTNAYTLRLSYAKAGYSVGAEWQSTFNKKNRSILESLWPLTVGKKAELNFIENFGPTDVRSWSSSIEVSGTEDLEINGLTYPTFVVQVHATSEEPNIYDGYAPEQEYTETYWYNPDSGLILKFERDWIRGGGQKSEDQYSLVRVTYPKGTTTHALKGTKARGEADKALLAEVSRLKREAEEARRAISQRTGAASAADKGREAEIAKLKQDEKAREAEIALLKQALEARFKAGGPGGKNALLDLGGVDFGNYHALVIGIEDYENLPKLETAVNDAVAVARVLKKNYGFKVNLLLDPSHIEVIDALDEYREELGPTDNLLIYYAGHGWLDEDSDRGYWLPVDAKPKRRSQWVSNATIIDTLKALGAKHVMVVADSCFSGTLTRSATMGSRTRTGDYWKKMAGKWARVAITSGGLEPVADKGGGNHSPFAKAFISALKGNQAVMDGTELFQSLRRPVMVAVDQTPEYSDVRGAGHDGGDFLFVRKK